MVLLRQFIICRCLIRKKENQRVGILAKEEMHKARKPPEPVPFDKPLVNPRVPELSLILDNDNQKNGVHIPKSNGNNQGVQSVVPRDDSRNAAEAKVLDEYVDSSTRLPTSRDIQSSQDANSYHAWRMKHKLFLPSETEDARDFAGNNIDCRPEFKGSESNYQAYKQANNFHETNTGQNDVRGKLDCNTSCEFDSDEYENYVADSAKNYMHFLETSLRGKYNKEQKNAAFEEMQNKNVHCSPTDLNAGAAVQNEGQQQRKQSFEHLSSDQVGNLLSSEELMAKTAPLTDCRRQYRENFSEVASHSTSQTQIPHAVTDENSPGIHTRRDFVPSYTDLESSRSVPLHQNEFPFPQQMYKDRYGTVNTNFTNKLTGLHQETKVPCVNEVQVTSYNEALQLPSPRGRQVVENVSPGHQELRRGSQSLGVESYQNTAHRRAQYNPHLHCETDESLGVRIVNRENCGGHNLRKIPGDLPMNFDVDGRACMMPHEGQQFVTARDVEYTNRTLGSAKNVFAEHMKVNTEKETYFPQNAYRNAYFDPNVHHETASTKSGGGDLRITKGGLPQNFVTGIPYKMAREVPQHIPAGNVEFSKRTVGFCTKNEVSVPVTGEIEKKTVFPYSEFAHHRRIRLDCEPATHTTIPKGQRTFQKKPSAADCCESAHRKYVGGSMSSWDKHKMTCGPNEKLESAQGYVVQKYFGDGGQLVNSSKSRNQVHNVENVCESHSCKDMQPFLTVNSKPEQFGDRVYEDAAAQRCGQCTPHQTCKQGCGHTCTAVAPKCSDQSDAVDRAMLLSMMDMIKWQSKQIQVLQEQLSGRTAPCYDRNREVASKATQTCPGQSTVSVGVGTTMTGERVPSTGDRGDLRQAGQADHFQQHCVHCSPPRRTQSVDESLRYHGLDVVNVVEPPISPVNPVHIDTQDCCEPDSVYPANLEARNLNARTQQENCVGWTFYNNVVGQVSKMLDPSPAPEVADVCRGGSGDGACAESKSHAAVEQMRKLDINRVTFDPEFGPWVDRMAVNNSNESESSIRMRALAVKYGKEDQLTEFPRFTAGGAKVPERLQDVTFYGMTTQTTNLSFATLRYLERYHLIPKSGNTTGGNIVQGTNPYTEPKPTANYPQPHSPAKDSYKILDISTLRQQPKLL